ncbi:hypothetical protein N431DRAFT_460330 [Stipitochalara longipes BDJ]|nr:hypothetical protein N431DRAFT_460330 [Stipitochalara longipes BDJ]
MSALTNAVILVVRVPDTKPLAPATSYRPQRKFHSAKGNHDLLWAGAHARLETVEPGEDRTMFRLGEGLGADYQRIKRLDRTCVCWMLDAGCWILTAADSSNALPLVKTAPSAFYLPSVSLGQAYLLCCAVRLALCLHISCFIFQSGIQRGGDYWKCAVVISPPVVQDVGSRPGFRAVTCRPILGLGQTATAKVPRHTLTATAQDGVECPFHCHASPSSQRQSLSSLMALWSDILLAPAVAPRENCDYQQNYVSSLTLNSLASG